MTDGFFNLNLLNGIIKKSNLYILLETIGNLKLNQEITNDEIYVKQFKNTKLFIYDNQIILRTTRNDIEEIKNKLYKLIHHRICNCDIRNKLFEITDIFELL